MMKGDLNDRIVYRTVLLRTPNPNFAETKSRQA